VANDYGRLSAADKARLKRARRRAGASKPTPPPVRGENAREKARVPVQARARENFEQTRRGKMSPADFLASIRGLNEGEKRDLGSYSEVRSREAERERFGKMVRRTPGAFVEPFDRAAGVGLSFNPKSEGFVSELKSIVHGAKYAKNVLMDPDSSRADKRNAALGVTSMAGLGGGVGRSGGPKVTAAQIPEAQRLVDALPEAKRLSRKQEKLRTEARKGRNAAALEAMEVGGRAGHEASLAALKGQLPKLRFGALDDLSYDDAEKLFRHIQDHPEFEGLGFTKAHTSEALRKMIDEGRVPTDGERKLLQQVFGPELAEMIEASRSRWSIASENLVEIANVPRAMKATLDLSAALRQGLVLGANHPVIWGKAWKPMLKAWRSEKFYDEKLAEIQSRPSFDNMRKHGISFTDLGNVENREEAFMSNLAERFPGIGPIVRKSSRAYTTFLNTLRADVYDYYEDMVAAGKGGGMLDTLRGKKVDELETHEWRDVAKWINTGTGRGTSSNAAIEQAMVPATVLLFSPRLLYSRIQLLNPVYYAKLSPFARKQAVLGMTKLMGGVLLTLELAKMNGAEVNMDPRSTDFAKIKFGDTRIDILGGLQQPFVAAYRIAKGESVSSTTGVTENLEGGFGSKSRLDIGENFFYNKLAPLPQYGRMWAQNQNFAGDEFDAGKEAGRLVVPIGVESTYEGFKSSPEAGVTTGIGGTFGLGVMTYNGDPAKTARAKRDAALAKRGPIHIRNHEDRVNALRKEWKANNLPNDPKAVEASRAIRNLDLAKKRAEKKKGDRLTSQEKARLAFRTHRRLIPEGISTWQANFANARTDEEWQSFYEELRQEIAEPFKYYGVNMDGS
jgi:hypothetical protein